MKDLRDEIVSGESRCESCYLCCPALVKDVSGMKGDGVDKSKGQVCTRYGCTAAHSGWIWRIFETVNAGDCKTRILTDIVLWTSGKNFVRSKSLGRSREGACRSARVIMEKSTPSGIDKPFLSILRIQNMTNALVSNSIILLS